MNEVSKMSTPMTLSGTTSATSLLESESGATPCALQGGPMTGLSGQVLAHASLSAPQAKDSEAKTPGTFGPHGSISSKSAALQSCLESRLKQQLITDGSTLFKMTWKEKATPLGRRVFLLRASALRTSDSASGSWLTPNANEDAAGSLRGKMQKMLTHQAKLRDPEGCANGMQLNANLARWLMGIPDGWRSCAPTEMPSSRKSRQSS